MKKCLLLLPLTIGAIGSLLFTSNKEVRVSASEPLDEFCLR